MDTRHLEAFRAVIDNGSMTGAAKALRKSQPAVSNLISRLEDELGFRLFNRGRGKFEPTPEAALFYDEACRTLASFDRAMQTGREIYRSKSGPLLIASQLSVATTLLPQLVSEFLRNRPGMTVRFLTRSSQLVRDLTHLQALDVGFAELPLDSSAASTEIFDLECVCMLTRDHPLATQDIITPEALAGFPFITLYREHMTYESIGRAFAFASAEWNVVAETEFFATACALATHGAGVTIVDPFTAADFQSRGLVARPFRPSIRYSFAMFRPHHRPPSRAASEFMAAFRRLIEPYL
jgi:DNA-binding transcriptional LysR family regulator